LLAARRGDAKGLLALADDYADRDESGQYSNFLDVYFTVTCNDLAADPDDATIQAMGHAWARQYPMFGVWQAAALTRCSGWQKHRTPIPPETAASSAPILVVGNLHDPATPYAGAVEPHQGARPRFPCCRGTAKDTPRTCRDPPASTVRSTPT
jgi:hypothetical protein